ncbi:Gcv operon activator [Variovorax sp. PBS-H4]|uniref:LysR family transcriptional regulator n=1 Tax=Variovorax sp. PBS-H4 TaxID=434008 RepID=UPI0013193641|nr:LysR family transcriptional regulator [Variovorax sp. PBS-H4]VTU34437.1 Gcv operon activator [Variovorax sp. PBS-H4]
MKRKIPSTVALCLFEAAARHESFARAAAEVFLTESAVSRQIAVLEQYLGVKLFSRVKKQVILTDAGRLYSRNIRGSLDEIEMHTKSLIESKGAGGVLELAVIPTFASRWLLPRLNDFLAKHPDITVNLSEKADPFSFHGTNFDAALHFDDPVWDSAEKVQLFEEEVVPVLSPQHFELAKFRTAPRLLALPLLHKRTRPEAWQRWFQAAGCSATVSAPAMRFELYAMVIDAARAGLGVGLVPRFYVQEDIERGVLAIPMDVSLKHEKRYCFVYPEHKRDSPVVQAFSRWVSGMAMEFSAVARPVQKSRRQA